MLNTNYNSDITFGKKYCLIPKCNAKCCSNAPIPFRFFDHMRTLKPEKFTRDVFATIPAPQTNPYCRDAILPITKPLKKKKVKGKEVFVRFL